MTCPNPTRSLSSQPVLLLLSLPVYSSSSHCSWPLKRTPLTCAREPRPSAREKARRRFSNLAVPQTLQLLTRNQMPSFPRTVTWTGVRRPALFVVRLTWSVIWICPNVQAWEAWSRCHTCPCRQKEKDSLLWTEFLKFEIAYANMHYVDHAATRQSSAGFCNRFGKSCRRPIAHCLTR